MSLLLPLIWSHMVSCQRYGAIAVAALGDGEDCDCDGIYRLFGVMMRAVTCKYSKLCMKHRYSLN